MRILFIGGTRFVGLAMARESLRRGHQVDVFHRGINPPKHLTGATDLRGDRCGDLSALARSEWDAVVDTCAYKPHEIQTMANALGSRFRKYVFVSSVGVYANDVPPNSDETAARADASVLAGKDLSKLAMSSETFGPLKVLCENEVLLRHADHLVIRPSFVIGPDDYTQRFPEWIRRIAAGGQVDAPEPRDAPIQYIDARDLAAFVVGAIEQDLQGAFNVAAPKPPFTFEKFLDEIIASVAPGGTRLHWLSVAEAIASGSSFPLWTGGPPDGRLALNSDAAMALGLSCRPLRDSARDVLEWTLSI